MGRKRQSAARQLELWLPMEEVAHNDDYQHRNLGVM